MGWDKGSQRSEDYKALKTVMEANGWVFLTQDGDGYFFEKGGEKIVIPSQILIGQ